MASTQTWADQPFPLIPTPSPDPSEASPHTAFHLAIEMTLAHNVLLRGLNAIYLQGPCPQKPQDISDFLVFCSAWVKMVHHHHNAEETVLFPELEKFTGREQIMGENREQHAGFFKGLEEFGAYARETSAREYSWDRVKALLDGFVPDLVQHLRDEIDTLLGLKTYDSAGLKEVWRKTEEAAKGDVRVPGMLDTILPMVLGCADKTFESGKHKFPPFPFFFPYLVDYWFSRKYKGAWRFCPCDMYGQPRPLEFTG